MRDGVIFSALFHLAVFIFAVVGLPEFRRPPPIVDQPISVEVVTIDQFTNPPRGKPEVSKKKKPEAKKPETRKSPALTPTPKEPEPKPEPKVAALPTPTPKTATKVKPKDDKAADPKRTRAKAKPRPKPRRKRLDFASVLRSVKNLDKKAKTAPRERSADAARKGARTNLATRPLSMSELDAVRRQIARCWNVPVGARDAETMVVDIYVVMNPDRTVREARIADASRMQRDPFFRTMAESALRAVLNPRCSPLELPETKFELWKTFTLGFNPKDMLGG